MYDVSSVNIGLLDLMLVSVQPLVTVPQSKCAGTLTSLHLHTRMIAEGQRARCQ